MTGSSRLFHFISIFGLALSFLGCNSEVSAPLLITLPNSLFSPSPTLFPTSDPPPIISGVSTLMSSSGTRFNTASDLSAVSAIENVTTTGLTSGPNLGGTPILVTGIGFDTSSHVFIGNGATRAPCPRIESPTAFRATSQNKDLYPFQFYCLTPPSGTLWGASDVFIVNSDSQEGTLPKGFNYLANLPTLSTSAPITPVSGAAPVAVTIAGTGFLQGVQVSLGGSPCAVTLLSSTQIVCTTSTHAIGNVDLVVSNPDRQSIRLASAYTYTLASGPLTDFSYPANPAWYSTFVPVPSLTPTPSGASQFSISPALPSSMTFDVTTGVISGTPSESIASQVYTVTASSSLGTKSTQLTFGVSDFGNGKQGALTANGSGLVVNQYSYMTNSTLPANSSSLNVRDPGLFSRGDLILLMQMQNASGTGLYWEFLTVVSIDGPTLSVGSPTRAAYTSGASPHITQVIRVPQYTDVNIPISNAIVPKTWQTQCTNCGGVLAFKASGTVTVNGALTATGAGFRGGAPGQSHNSVATGFQGESIFANQGGGGGGRATAQETHAGGGGSYGSAGAAGIGPPGAGGTGGSAGSLYGVANLMSMFLGSGGGGGAIDLDTCTSTPRTPLPYGTGGAGGGIIIVYANSIQVGPSGRILARGQDQQPDPTSYTPARPLCTGNIGGAGSGGSILLKAFSINVGSGAVLATGGNLAGYGGAGGDGRIRFDSNLITGSSQPTFTGVFTDVPPTQLTYSLNPAHYVKNKPIINNIPQVQGGNVTRYTLSPPLPTGLQMDSTTGIISGTPTQNTDRKIYTITATNLNGSTTAAVTIGVLDFGSGLDGPLVLNAGVIKTDVNTFTYVTSPSVNTGALSLTVDNSGGFQTGDLALQ